MCEHDHLPTSHLIRERERHISTFVRTNVYLRIVCIYLHIDEWYSCIPVFIHPLKTWTKHHHDWLGGGEVAALRPHRVSIKKWAEWYLCVYCSIDLYDGYVTPTSPTSMYTVRGHEDTMEEEVGVGRYVSVIYRVMSSTNMVARRVWRDRRTHRQTTPHHFNTHHEIIAFNTVRSVRR